MDASNLSAQYKELSRHFLTMFENGAAFSDVVVRVGKREMHLHSQILVARCSVFSTMFTSGFKETINRIVEIDDFGFDTATHFFKFLYTCAISVLSSSECLELFKMANKYQVTSLESRMKEVIVEQLSTDNWLEVLKVATDVDCQELRDAAMRIPARGLSLVHLQQDPRFMELDGDAMRCLLAATITERDATIAERDATIAKRDATECRISYLSCIPLTVG
eukprot:Selendium_serpulae@DN6423_c1_g1_i2.p1